MELSDCIIMDPYKYSRSELENTNEELDIVKAQAHLMVLHRQEEIVYADSGLKEILELLNGLHSKLCSFITANVEKGEES